MKLRFPRATAGALLAAVAATLLLSACGEKQERETAVTERDRITLILDYFPTPTMPRSTRRRAAAPLSAQASRWRSRPRATPPRR